MKLKLKALTHQKSEETKSEHIDVSAVSFQIKPNLHLQNMGINSQNLNLGRLGEEIVYIQNLRMSFAMIEKFNQSPHACKISSVLETDPNDS